MQDLNVTLIQATLDWHDAGANRARFSDLIGSINEATDLVVLPETFTTGFTMDTEHQAETMDGDTVSCPSGGAQINRL